MSLLTWNRNLRALSQSSCGLDDFSSAMMLSSRACGSIAQVASSGLLLRSRKEVRLRGVSDFLGRLFELGGREQSGPGGEHAELLEQVGELGLIIFDVLVGAAGVVFANQLRGGCNLDLGAAPGHVVGNFVARHKRARSLQRELVSGRGVA